MKMKQKLIAGAIALSAMAGFAVPAAHAEVAASVGANNMYYWRGLDLGSGDAQVWGDLKLTGAGFYGGVWAGSGDAVWGTEYDTYVGYGASFGDFKFDVSVVSYNYATYDVAPGDFAEAIVAVGYGPVTFTYYDNIANTTYGEGEEIIGFGYDDYNYMTLAATFGAFTAKYGVHEDDLAHVDLTYAYNEKLSFTIGKVVDDVEGFYNDEAKIIVSLSLPIE